MTGHDPNTVAAKLTKAQRAAVENADEDGRLPSGVRTGTAVALMDRDLCGPQEYQHADEDSDDPGERGHWLTDLGLAVREIFRAEAEGFRRTDLPDMDPAELADLPGFPVDGVPEAVQDEAPEDVQDEPEAVPEPVQPEPTPDPRAASDMGSVTVAAVEAAWHAIQARHPEVPDVVVISGGTSRVVRRKGREYVEVDWGTFHANQWTTDGGQRHELLVSGECLGKGARFTLATVLHEAAHGLAHVRNVKEVSRAGKYHNKRFLKLAAELGLVWPEGKQPDSSFGFNAPELPDAVADTYADVLDELESKRKAWRTLVRPSAPASGDEATGADEGDAEEGADEAPARPRSKNTKPKAECGCGPDKAVWASRRVLEALTVTCSACGESYKVVEPT